MKILTFATQPLNAIAYYRLAVPFETMVDMKYDIDFVLDDFHPRVSPEEREEAIRNSDTLVFHTSLLTSKLSIPDMIQKAPPMYDFIHGRIQFPPTMFLDVDDLYDHIHPTNPSFAVWGTRGADGTPLQKGCQIVARMSDGSQEVLFEDGKLIDSMPNEEKRIFDLAANYRRNALMMYYMQQAHITTTTPFMAEYFKKNFKAQHVHVYPNCLRFDHWDKVELRDHKEVRIMWQGGSSHFPDMKAIYRPLLRVLEKHDNVKMILWGQEWVWLNAMMPKEKFEFIQWVPYERHRLRLSTLGIDINLCPLDKTTFNQGKSAIKWYEASVAEHPAATLAANWGPYQEIQDGKNGLLYDGEEDFENKLTQLIEDAELRQELASNACDWVHENRDAKKNVPALYEYYMKCRENHIDSFEAGETVSAATIQ